MHERSCYPGGANQVVGIPAAQFQPSPVASEQIPALARAGVIENGVRELVVRLRRVSGLIRSRPQPGDQKPGATGPADLASHLQCADAELQEAHRLVSQIEADLAA